MENLLKKKINRRDFLKMSTGMGAVVITGGKQDAAPREPKGNGLNSSLIAVAESSSPIHCVEKAVELAGGIRRFIPKGSRVALLPNSQSRYPGSFTHPGVIRATVRLCKTAGAVDIKALSWLPKNFWSATGLDKVLEEEGAGLIISRREDEYFDMIQLKKGKALKVAYLHKALAEFDILINMPIIYAALCADFSSLPLTHFSNIIFSFSHNSGKSVVESYVLKRHTVLFGITVIAVITWYCAG